MKKAPKHLFRQSMYKTKHESMSALTSLGPCLVVSIYLLHKIYVKVSSCCIKKNGTSVMTTIKTIDTTFLNLGLPVRYNSENGSPLIQLILNNIGTPIRPQYDPAEAWLKTF